MISKKIALTSILLSSSVWLNGCDLLESESHNTPAKIAQIPIANTSCSKSTEELIIPKEENKSGSDSGNTKQILVKSDSQILYEKWKESKRKEDELSSKDLDLKINYDFLLNKHGGDKSHPEVKEADAKITELYHVTKPVWNATNQLKRDYKNLTGRDPK
ncbi:hypothetical protein CKC_05115 [Candidatus Liberibacter solanacearum CLso-ZC1]|uniref:Lipoprotein n=1 Tax=Liberibacter solanacearum (strain CLso-ZC1) TaxID=658172 RepID=E4UDU1_LIBSC|nr:hypothetical protein [Candidatus Liberibacter solanacearum]ADR52769.1 hypothetical protein CKC_05115 [Candidatus Liberibacter solanacearum CLso-ZC1]